MYAALESVASRMRYANLARSLVAPATRLAGGQ